eukprot:1086393-Rhodomonas_salina.2
MSGVDTAISICKPLSLIQQHTGFNLAQPASVRREQAAAGAQAHASAARAPALAAPRAAQGAPPLERHRRPEQSACSCHATDFTLR